MRGILRARRMLVNEFDSKFVDAASQRRDGVSAVRAGLTLVSSVSYSSAHKKLMTNGNQDRKSICRQAAAQHFN